MSLDNCVCRTEGVRVDQLADRDPVPAVAVLLVRYSSCFGFRFQLAGGDPVFSFEGSVENAKGSQIRDPDNILGFLFFCLIRYNASERRLLFSHDLGEVLNTAVKIPFESSKTPSAELAKCSTGAL